MFLQKQFGFEDLALSHKIQFLLKASGCPWFTGGLNHFRDLNASQQLQIPYEVFPTSMLVMTNTKPRYIFAVLTASACKEHWAFHGCSEQ